MPHGHHRAVIASRTRHSCAARSHTTIQHCVERRAERAGREATVPQAIWSHHLALCSPLRRSPGLLAATLFRWRPVGRWPALARPVGWRCAAALVAPASQRRWHGLVDARRRSFGLPPVVRAAARRCGVRQSPPACARGSRYASTRRASLSRLLLQHCEHRVAKRRTTCRSCPQSCAHYPLRIPCPVIWPRPAATSAHPTCRWAPSGDSGASPAARDQRAATTLGSVAAHGLAVKRLRRPRLRGIDRVSMLRAVGVLQPAVTGCGWSRRPAGSNWPRSSGTIRAFSCRASGRRGTGIGAPISSVVPSGSKDRRLARASGHGVPDIAQGCAEFSFRCVHPGSATTDLNEPVQPLPPGDGRRVLSPWQRPGLPGAAHAFS